MTRDERVLAEACVAITELRVEVSRLRGEVETLRAATLTGCPQCNAEREDPTTMATLPERRPVGNELQLWCWRHGLVAELQLAKAAEVGDLG